MLTTLDIIIIIAYFIGMILIGYLSGRDNKTQEDYLLAGRSMPWIPVALSISATMISANSLVGGPGWAYTSGIKPFMVNITVPLAVFFAIYITAPVIYNLRVTSVYEYMEYRLGPISRNLTVVQFFINSLIQISSMVFIPSLLIQTITGWSLNIIVPIIVFIAIFYTLLGGIKAVIWTDAIQTLIIFLTVILVFYIPLKVLDIRLFDSFAMARGAGKLDIFDFSFNLSVENTFWAAIIGGTIMWIRYFSFDQAQVQRILTSKSIKGVKSSLAVSSILMNGIYFLILLVGLILWVFYDGVEFTNSNQIMIGFILEELPIGILGLVIAGTFAAAMSSVDSLLNSMTTVFVKDIYEKYFHKGKEEASLKITMTISAVIGILVIFVVIFAFGGTVKSVLDTVGKYISYFTGPACGAFLLAMFTYKANDKGVATGFVVGITTSYLIIQSIGTFWLWNAGIGCIITVVVGFLASLAFNSNKSVEDIKRFTAKGMKEKLLLEGNTQEDGVSKVPFVLDKYGKMALVFFFAQFLLFALIA